MPNAGRKHLKHTSVVEDTTFKTRFLPEAVFTTTKFDGKDVEEPEAARGVL